MTGSRPIVLVDSYNLFIRHYTANPSISHTGNHVGAIVGYLKAIHWLVDKIQPEKIIIVWEGGGSTRKRALYKDYKKQKKPLKINQYFELDIPDTHENWNYQMVTLLSLLKTLPVCQLYVSDCEADDIIGYLCNQILKDKKKIIFSSDRDYYQLVNKDTNVCTLNKRNLVNINSVKEELGVYPKNVCLLKSICGDRSDNVDGIRGAGITSVIKRLPKITEDNTMLMDEFFSYNESIMKESKIKIHKEIHKNHDLIRRNWRLMNLESSQNLSHQQIVNIEKSVSTFSPSIDKIEFIKILTQEGINLFDINWFFYTVDMLMR